MLTIAPTLAIGENASMSQRAMPFIFLNMTGEMTYILEQRLIAQKVTQTRCRQVLSDILKVVFNEKFLCKLFGPQEQYSRSSLRQYFEKMAHSSVMRLNEPRRSMDRLFDMLTMTVKQQVMLVAEPDQLIHVTINHLNGIRQIAGYDEEVLANVKLAHELLVNAYKDTQTWEMALIRCALLNHFQDLRIRVSQLMRLGLQMDDGRFALHRTPIQVPNGATPPGTIRYFDKGQVSRVMTFVIEDEYVVSENKGTFDLMDVKNRCTALGDNIFRDEQSGSSDSKLRASQKKKKSVSGADEAKLLSKLINRQELVEGKDNFTLSLFDNDELENQPSRPETSSTVASDKRPRSRSRGTGGAQDGTKVRVNKTSKTLAGAMQELEIKPSSSSSSTSAVKQTSSSTPTTKKTRGEELLKMMDDEPSPSTSAMTSKTTAQRAPRSRSASRKAIRNQSAVGQRKT